MAGPLAFAHGMVVYTWPNRHETFIFRICPCHVCSSTFSDLLPEPLIDSIRELEGSFQSIFVFPRHSLIWSQISPLLSKRNYCHPGVVALGPPPPPPRTSVPGTKKMCRPRHMKTYRIFFVKPNRKNRYVSQRETFFLSFFLGWRIPHSITALSRWWAPDESHRTQETVPDGARTEETTKSTLEKKRVMYVSTWRLGSRTGQGFNTSEEEKGASPPDKLQCWKIAQQSMETCQ